MIWKLSTASSTLTFWASWTLSHEHAEKRQRTLASSAALRCRPLSCWASARRGVLQLIRDGYLKPSPDGSITAAAAENCRQHAPVAWQIPGAQPGQKSAAKVENERLNKLWHAVAVKMAARGYEDWQRWHCRKTFRDLKACIISVDQRLMGD